MHKMPFATASPASNTLYMEKTLHIATGGRRPGC